MATWKTIGQPASAVQRRARALPWTGRRRARDPRAGMTMIEVLVAASVLLVGIWAVASGFPTLMTNIMGEQRRTQATRLVDGEIDNLRQSPGSLPEGIRADVATAATVDISSKPKDPSVTTNAPNSRDDIYDVEGLMARIPAPAPGSSYSLLTPAQGLIDTTTPGLTVYGVDTLTRMAYQPDDPATNAPDGYYYLASDGTLYLPAGYDGARLDYVWVDPQGVSHWVEGERLLRANQNAASQTMLVQPAWHHVLTPSFGFSNALTQPSRCQGLKAFTLVTTSTPQPGQVAVEANFGAGLLFNRADAGKTVLLDYTLRLVGGKRALYLAEDRTLGESISKPDDSAGGAPNMAQRLVRVQLGWGNLDQLIPAVAGSTPAIVLAVDLVNGQTYYSTSTTGNGMLSPTPDDIRSGQVVLQVPTTAIGHLVRFFYKTADQAALEVYKPPANFLDAATAAAYSSPSDLAWRTWTPLTPPHGGAELQFAACNVGHTVSVDYVYRDTHSDGTYADRLVTGELHTLGGDSTGQHAICRLNNTATEVHAVHGVSLRVRGWWMTPGGLLRNYDVETILPASGAM